MIDTHLILKKVVFYVLILITWQLIYLSDLLPELVLPSPSQVGESMIIMIMNGSLAYALGTSFMRLAIGLVISVTIGFTLGYYMTKHRILYDTFGSLVLGLQSIPSIAWVPLSIIWFGINDMSIIFVIIASTIFSVIITTYTGIRNVPTLYIKAATNMGAKGFVLMYEVVIPAALPYLISGLRQAWSFAWRGLISAEMLITILGLGFLLITARNVYDMPQVISVMIIIMTIGLVVDGFIFSRIENKVATRYGIR